MISTPKKLFLTTNRNQISLVINESGGQWKKNFKFWRKWFNEYTYNL